LKILGPQKAQNRSAAGWQWFADPRERVEIGKRGFFQQAPRNLLKNSLFRKAASRVENSWPTNGPESIGSGLAMVC
jgi:hypothetical protein